MTKAQLAEWAWARVELNATTAETNDWTPAEWDALLEAWKQKQERRAWEMAGLKATLANLLSTRKDGRGWVAADFMPEQPKPPPDPDKIMEGFRRAFD